MTAPDDTRPVLLTGDDLSAVIRAFNTDPRPHLIRIWLDGGGVKFKFNQGTWSPPLGHHE